MRYERVLRWEAVNKYMKIIKLVGVGILLLSFFLPMSSCSYTVPIDLVINESDPASSDVPEETRTTIMYAREYVDLGEIGAWLNILAFTWPLLLILLHWRFAGRKYSWLIICSGVLLSVFSAGVVYAWADIGKPLIGAYVGGGAAVVLFAVYVGELVEYFKKRNEHAGRIAQDAE